MYGVNHSILKGVWVGSRATTLLGGSWVVTSGVISKVTIVTIVIIHIMGLITPGYK